MKEEFTRIEARDGIALAVHRMGKGRPVVLLHGLFSDAQMNWIKFGHASVLVEAGFETIMPDLRAHGRSDKPHDPSAYPDEVLIRDVEDIVGVCGLSDYDLAGFSLGARTALHAVIEGLSPRRLVLAGVGLEGLKDWDRRAGFFRDAIDRFDQIKRGDPAFFAVSFMKTMGIDRTASRLLLGTMHDIDEAKLARVTMPTLVLCGSEDRDNGSPQALADALPDGRHVAIPGTHMSSVTEAAMGREIVAYLSE